MSSEQRFRLGFFTYLEGERTQAEAYQDAVEVFVAADQLGDLLRVLDSHLFAGNPDLRWPLPPSTSPREEGFLPRSYWRGPVWPVINWLLWWSLEGVGEKKRADRLKATSLAQLSDGHFVEYYEPFTGEALGSDDQSWTAAVALDWLAEEGPEASPS